MFTRGYLIGALEDFFLIYGMILPIDFHSIIFQDGHIAPPTRLYQKSIYLLYSYHDSCVWRDPRFWGYHTKSSSILCCLGSSMFPNHHIRYIQVLGVTPRNHGASCPRQEILSQGLWAHRTTWSAAACSSMRRKIPDCFKGGTRVTQVVKIWVEYGWIGLRF